jgi:predicted DNA-binding transcriptional regulator AlpA
MLFSKQDTPTRMNTTNNELLRLPAVMERCVLRKTAIYKLNKQGKIPRPMALTSTARAWYSDEVDQHQGRASPVQMAPTAARWRERHHRRHQTLERHFALIPAPRIRGLAQKPI